MLAAWWNAGASLGRPEGWAGSGSCPPGAPDQRQVAAGALTCPAGWMWAQQWAAALVPIQMNLE